MYTLMHCYLTADIDIANRSNHAPAWGIISLIPFACAREYRMRLPFFGAMIEVLEPIYLRKTMRSRVSVLFEMYGIKH